MISSSKVRPSARRSSLCEMSSKPPDPAKPTSSLKKNHLSPPHLLKTRQKNPLLTNPQLRIINYQLSIHLLLQSRKQMTPSFLRSSSPPLVQNHQKNPQLSILHYQLSIPLPLQNRKRMNMSFPHPLHRKRRIKFFLQPMPKLPLSGIPHSSSGITPSPDLTRSFP